MMAQFMMDLKTEPRLSPSLYSPASPKMGDSPSCGRPQSTDSGVLDLSKRRDSLETSRKTPSPSYHCFSDIAGTPPPSNHSSPQCEVASTTENSIVLNYSELLARSRRLSPTKSLLHFDDLHHHHSQQQQQQHPEPTALMPPAVAFHHALALCKPETTESLLQQHLLQRGGPNESIPSYLLAGAHHHHRQHPQHPQQPFVNGANSAPVQQTPLAPFSPSPIRLRKLDTISESGSEGTTLVSSSHQRKEPANDDPTVTSKMTQQQQQEQHQQQYPMVVGRDGKLSRPFKAYPRDPLSLAAGFVASDTILDTNSAEKYNLFRKRMLEQIHAANGGQPTVSNPKMRRLAAKSSSSTAALSDASSESCDEKTSSQQQQQRTASAIVFESKMVAKETKRTGSSAATNQRLDDDATSPSKQDDERHCDSDSSHHSGRSERVDRSFDLTSRTNEGNEQQQQQQQQQDNHLATASSSTSSSGAAGPTSGLKDSAYYERRKKNNAAAKKSRDRRRIKEDEIAIRAAFLERENIELKFELAAARKQLALYGVTASVAS
ncbi:hypothetical protein AND_010023 [Anopheles darlingi]|uniref:BZIP domain-containing protein n=1 Tax=Anopheles darlingi TaxID=43151 RepID=W5J2D3_ANODA|nr:hypothetical protein AND_010023 [Anopheles darlingi]